MAQEGRRRGALILLVSVTFCACLALGWWQWQRFESGSGSFQNLGYALQWPLFAGFAVYAYRRFVRLEAGAEPQSKPTDTDVAADLLPSRPVPARTVDAETAAYNVYLAELNARAGHRSDS